MLRQPGLEIVRNILRQEGVSAFWKGNVPAEFLYILYGALQFTAYSLLNLLFASAQTSWLLNVSPLVHLLVVGGCLGIVSTLLTYPFDVLRTRLAANQNLFLSMRGVVAQIYADRGLPGFFVGISPSLVSVAANLGLFFWAYSVARTMAQGTWGVEAGCGLVAGVVAKAITFPLDTIRKRMQVGHGNHASALFVSQWRQYGWLSFYRGFAVSLAKTAPTSAISVAVYEYTLAQTRAMTGTLS